MVAGVQSAVDFCRMGWGDWNCWGLGRLSLSPCGLPHTCWSQGGWTAHEAIFSHEPIPIGSGRLCRSFSEPASEASLLLCAYNQKQGRGSAQIHDPQGRNHKGYEQLEGDALWGVIFGA